MKIYTRTGDDGDTGLFGGTRVAKDHVRIEAIGAVDELNSHLGSALAQLQQEAGADLVDPLRTVQSDIFALGAHLATPGLRDGGRVSAPTPTVPAERIAEMERWMDGAENELPPLRVFILPGGTEAAARLHVARTVCRRAERRVIALARAAAVDATVIRYLNRLSDLLFTFARVANHRAGVEDVKWDGGRSSP